MSISDSDSDDDSDFSGAFASQTQSSTNLTLSTMTTNQILSSSSHPLHDICAGVAVAGQNPTYLTTHNILKQVLQQAAPHGGDPNINTSDADGVTPLHLAIISPPVVVTDSDMFDEEDMDSAPHTSYLHDPVKVLAVLLSLGHNANAKANKPSDTETPQTEAEASSSSSPPPVMCPSLFKKVDGSPPLCTALSMDGMPWPTPGPRSTSLSLNLLSNNKDKDKDSKKVFYPTQKVVELLIEEAAFRDEKTRANPNPNPNSGSDSDSTNSGENSLLYKILTDPDTSQNTPLGLAVSSNSLPVISLILTSLKRSLAVNVNANSNANANANANAPLNSSIFTKKADRIGSKPLHLVRSYASFELLLNSCPGIDLLAVDYYGRNFFHALLATKIGPKVVGEIVSGGRVGEGVLQELFNMEDVKGRKPRDEEKLKGYAKTNTNTKAKTTKIITHELCLKHHTCSEIRRDGVSDEQVSERTNGRI